MISRMWIYLIAWLLIGASSSEAGERVADHRLLASPDGVRLVVTAERAKLKVLDSGGALVTEIPLPSPAVEVAFSPSGSQLAICLDGGGLVVADVASGAQKRLKAGGVCSDLYWSRDGGRLYFVLTSVDRSKREPDVALEVRIIEMGTGAEKLLHSSKLKIPLPTLGPSTTAEPPAVSRKNSGPALPIQPPDVPKPGTQNSGNN